MLKTAVPEPQVANVNEELLPRNKTTELRNLGIFADKIKLK
jgi:hypothetical protein